jgi:hypothetical protein
MVIVGLFMGIVVPVLTLAMALLAGVSRKTQESS